MARNGPKKGWPTAGVPATQRVKDAATATGATMGFNAGKLVQERKRLLMPDMGQRTGQRRITG